MCGLCGRLELERDRPAATDIVAAMTAQLAHRGPDDASVWSGGPVALGHRRLSIIDLAGGHQPLSNETGTVQVVLNGEIYNFTALRHELEARGHAFRTHSDTEVIAHGYEEWELELPARLQGMFAIAVWDAPRQRLFLVRDRLGIKPLFYAYRPGRFLSFASEVKSLLADPELHTEPDVVAVDQYLSLQYVPAPRTGLVDVAKLPPAHALTVDRDRPPRLWEYWDPANVTPLTSYREARERVAAVVTEAVRSHLVSDVPVGCFLSGGLDSSVVTALMARAQAAPVDAITVGFSDAAWDERPYAELVARRYGCAHHTRVLDFDASATFDTVVALQDEPFADWSTLPTYLVSQAARERVKVVLTGDGGDELFGGYARHRVQRLEGLVRLLADRLPRSLVGAVTAGYPARWPGAASIGNLAHPVPLALARKHAHGFFVSAAARAAVAGPAWRDRLARDHGDAFAEPFERAFARVSHRDPLTAALYVELKTYLVDDVLTKVDRMSMAHGLEVRPPLLDHHVVECALALRAGWKVGWTKGKLIYRDAFGRLLPQVLWRRPKRGFDIPADAWLRTTLKEQAWDLLFGTSARARGWTDGATVQRLWDAQQRGAPDYARRLWALMMLEAWMRRLDSRREPLRGAAPRRREGASLAGAP